jgi:hypothetical protein
MRSWIRKPVGAVLLVALLAVWGLAQAPPPFTGRIKVEISPTGAGNISLNPAGDLYGSIYFYTSPTTVWLTASPNSGYAFVRWEIWSSIPASGDPETRTANPTSITLSTEKPDWTVRAVFQEVGSLKVTIQPPEAVAAGAQWKATAARLRQRLEEQRRHPHEPPRGPVHRDLQGHPGLDQARGPDGDDHQGHHHRGHRDLCAAHGLPQGHDPAP